MRRKFGYGLLILVCLTLTYVFIQSVERYEELVDRGWSLAALRNPFLAAEKFLAAQGIAVRSTDRARVVGELKEDGSLLIKDASLIVNERFADDLLAWLEAGGHLIVQAPWYENAEVFFQHFDIYKFSNDGKTAEAEDDMAAVLAALREERLLREEMETLRSSALRKGGGMDEVLRELEAETDPERLTRLHFGESDHELLIDFGTGGALYHPEAYGDEGNSPYPPYYWVGNESGITFMQLDVGAGLLSVMVDMGIWDNSRIGMFDHAHLLAGLVGVSSEVVFLTGVRAPSLITMIRSNFVEFIVAALLCLLAWIVYRARRFGPVLLTEQEDRRSFAEHLQASGHFLWRNKQSQALLNAVRSELWQTIQRRFSGSADLPEGERLAPVLQHTQLEISELHRLMHGPAPQDELQFLTMIKSLQEIRKAL